MQERKSGALLAGRYQLDRQLSKGRSTDIWRAEDRSTRSTVALKILNAGHSCGALRREWQTSLRLVHAHIVRVFEFHEAVDGSVGSHGSHGSHGDCLFSLQLIEGDDLSLLSGRHYTEILAPIGLLAEALAYCHSRGVVHHDVKASNVLLDGNGVPYLIDFGVAVAIGDDAAGATAIASSPQQLTGEKAQAADDIYALGGLIYELVSGDSAYSSQGFLADIRDAAVPPLRSANGDELPAELSQLVHSMLAADAAARPDAGDVVQRIRALGIRPGPARVAQISSSTTDEVIESRSLQRKPKVSPVAPAAARPGLSSTMVGSALLVLLILLAVVVFWLPNADFARDDSNEVAAADTAGEAPQTVTDESPASSAASPPDDEPARDDRVQAREAMEQVLGELLAKRRTLEGRAVQRWGGLPWMAAEESYQAGDAAYLARNYGEAEAHYTESLTQIEPLLEQVDVVFATTLEEARSALEAADTIEALRLYELAVAISPSHGPALAGLARARSLENVLSLTEQGVQHERDLEFAAARQSFAAAVTADPEWQPAVEGLARVDAAINQMQFEARMTEGLQALAADDYFSARAAFRQARVLQPASSEPNDGLLQVEQGLRLNRIGNVESRARQHESAERWQDAIDAYEELLELDANLVFAQQGLLRSREMAALHKTLDEYLQNPDDLSAPATMQRATQLVVDITVMPDPGPRLVAQRDDLSKLLKRAATPLAVQLISDNQTTVSVYKVAQLGTFSEKQLSLRPGTYVAVGSRPGYRDVRLEFRVAPEIDMTPVVVQCEEKI